MLRSCVRGLAAAAVALAAVVGCGTGPATGDAPNILIILVDALRADRLGANGSTRGLTPFLDGLADRGVVFHNAYASAPWTNPSVASLFTSRHAWQHGVTFMAHGLPAGEVTLAEALAERGYATAGYSANFLVGGGNGFGQGFDVYSTPAPSVIPGVQEKMPARAEVLNRMFLEWWRARRTQKVRQPAFVYLHYIETHTPYAPPREALEKVFQGRALPDVDKANRSIPRANLVPPGAPEVQDFEGLYDAQVLAADIAIAKLFGDLERDGFLENAVVVVTADHGEALWDHGAWGHGGALYNEQIQVPLLMLVPGRDARTDVHEVVSLVDVAPTLLDLSGVPPPPSFEGRALRPLMAESGGRALFGLEARARGGSWPNVAYSDMALSEESAKKHAASAVVPHHLRSVIVGSNKLIRTLDGGARYYDLARDPHEHGEPPLAEAEQAKLQQALAAAGAPQGIIIPTTATKPIDEERREMLRMLGYVE